VFCFSPEKGGARGAASEAKPFSGASNKKWFILLIGWNVTFFREGEQALFAVITIPSGNTARF
jgi:hypothetical protein